MKTFKEFNEESREQLDEIAPALALAGKVIGGGLAAYSGYSALKNLSKGKFKQAGLDALGVIPGGRVFKGIRALGGAKNLAKAGSFVQSANRFNVTGMTPNAYAKGVDKTFDVATKAVTSPFKGNKTNKPNQPGSGKKVESEKTYTPYNPTISYDTGKKYKQALKK